MPDRPFRVVRLSHVNDPEHTPIFPGDPAFTLDIVASIPEHGYYLQSVSQGEHTGTHWGAPGHFTAGGLMADQLDAEDLVLPAIKIDVRRQAAADADFALSVADLQAWEEEHGPIAPESAVILWTGWESRWGSEAYASLDDTGTMHQPGFSVDAVDWLLERGILGVRGALGIDTFGPDRGIDSSYAVSKLLYNDHRISLENLANLRELPITGAFVLVGGTINRGGSGSPATIYGVIPRRN